MPINEYQYAGFFTGASISAFHFQDIAIALILGFAGALGGWVFKKVKDIISKYKK